MITISATVENGPATAEVLHIYEGAFISVKIGSASVILEGVNATSVAQARELAASLIVAADAIDAELAR